MGKFYLQERIRSFGLRSYSNNNDFWINNSKIPEEEKKINSISMRLNEASDISFKEVCHAYFPLL